MLFEDEEDNGLGRERQFKWKNVNESNWNDENKNNENDDGTGAGRGESDEENEEEWRKMRYEREILLKDSNTNETIQTNVDSPAVIVISNQKKKITIVKSANNTPQLNSNTSTPFLINKGAQHQVYFFFSYYTLIIK